MAFNFMEAPLGYIFAFLAVACAVVAAALAAALADGAAAAASGATPAVVSAKAKEMKDMTLAAAFFQSITIPFAVVAAGLLIAKV